MDAKTKINRYRERLDKTLFCDDLTNKNNIRTSVENRLLQSPQYRAKGDNRDLLETRTNELVNFLGMLQIASANNGRNSSTSGMPSAEWKVRQDNEECRIMYREGPSGTPFHVLLVEGYVDGPVDACLCVAWETALYKKWWPQFNYPAFKVSSSQCVRQIEVGEQISTVRFKVPWPLLAREAVLHYYEFEFFQEDLVVVMIKTIDDVERDGSLYGITSDLIPESKDVVRLGLVGGLAIQKVNDKRSYFRLISSVDMKLDFVPPSLINFISRQLIGSGFKLCQKAVASIAKGNKDFSKALEGPMYSRIRQAIHIPKTVKAQESKTAESNEGKSIVEDGRLKKMVQTDSEKDTIPRNLPSNIPDKESPDVDGSVVREIEEEEILAENSELKDENAISSQRPSFEVVKSCNGIHGKKISPRPEVEQALGTLDRVIDTVKDLHNNMDITSNPRQNGFGSLAAQAQLRNSNNLAIPDTQNSCSM